MVLRSNGSVVMAHPSRCAKPVDQPKGTLDRTNRARWSLSSQRSFPGQRLQTPYLQRDTCCYCLLLLRNPHFAEVIVLFSLWV